MNYDLTFFLVWIRYPMRAARDLRLRVRLLYTCTARYERCAEVGSDMGAVKHILSDFKENNFSVLLRVGYWRIFLRFNGIFGVSYVF